MSDSFVQVAPDSTGKAIDAQSLLNAVASLVYRQTVTIGDPSNINGVASVTNGALLVEAMPSAEGEFQEDVLKMILIELRVLNTLIADEFRKSRDLDSLRIDAQQVTY